MTRKIGKKLCKSKKCCKYLRRCVDGVCKSKTLKCKKQRKCKVVKRAIYSKCYALSKRKLKSGKGHCNIRTCCKFLRTCENNNCKSKKLSCKVHVGTCKKFFARCSKWKMGKASETKFCRYQICCKNRKSCKGGKCSVAKIKCNRKTKCQKIIIKNFRKCGKWMQKITKTKKCQVQKCCRYRRGCLNGKCSRKLLGCKSKRKCIKRCIMKVRRFKRCKKIGVHKRGKMTCPVTECCIHVKKCCSVKGCSTKKNTM